MEEEMYVIWMRSSNGGFAYMAANGDRIHACNVVPKGFTFKCESRAKQAIKRYQERLRYRAPELFDPNGYEYKKDLMNRLSKAEVVRIH